MAAAPTVGSAVPATGTTITVNQSLQYAVSSSGPLASLTVDLASAGAVELIYAGGAFTSPYAAGSTLTPSFTNLMSAPNGPYESAPWTNDGANLISNVSSGNLAPDGSLTAETIKLGTSAGTTAQRFYQSNGAAFVLGDNTVTTVYFKPGTADGISVGTAGGVGFNFCISNTGVITQTIGGPGAVCTAVSAPNGYFKVTVKWTVDAATGGYVICYIGQTINAQVAGATVTVWGISLQEATTTTLVLKRASGWPTNPTINTFATDPSGLSNVATPLSWLLSPGISLVTGINSAIGPRYPFWLADYFRDSIRRRAMQGQNPASFSDAMVLNLLNEELNAWLVPTYIGANEGHFIHFVALPVTPNTLTNQLGSGVVDLPPDAWGSEIRSMAAVDGNNNPIAQISIELDPGWGPNAWGGVGGTPRAYYLTNSQIQLLGDPGSQTIGIWYFKRPSRLVYAYSNLAAQPATLFNIPGSGPSYAVEVTSVAAGDGLTYYVVNTNGYTLPLYNQGNFNTKNAGQVLVEVNQGRPPFQNRVAAFTPLVVPGASDSFVQVPASGGTIPVDGGGNQLIQAGDWLCVSGFAPVLTDVPSDIIPFFLEWCSAKLMASRGDSQSMAASGAMMKAASDAMKEFLEPRNQAAERYVDSGLKRTGGGFWWGWRRG